MKAIVFLYYRAGSTFFESLTGKSWRLSQLKGDYSLATQQRQRLIDPFQLPTIPEVPSFDSGSPVRPTDSFSGPAVWMIHIGDWWGQLKSKDIPGPYDIDTPEKWGINDLLSLPGNDWKFISLVRDGRNQIESLRQMKGGIEEQRNNEDPEDYFKVLCKSYFNRASIISDCLVLPNYRMFRFEDLMSNPIETLDNMFEFLGLELDKEFCIQQLKEVQSFKTVHSSFGGLSKANQRWASWTTEEKEIFDEICSEVSKKLGYP